MTDKTKQTATPPSNPLYTPCLRQKKRSYADSGLGTPASGVKTNSASKKLLYMQDVNTDKPQEKQLDLYEFDSDSEGIRHRRKKRVKRNRSKKTPARRARANVATAMEETKSYEGHPLEITENEENGGGVCAGKNDESISMCFGFDEGCNISKVTIVKLKPNEELNLSVVATTAVQDCLTWRFTDPNVRRNPLFIQLKDSSLPRLDQEMVLDHSIVENFENSSKITNSSTKKPTQKKRRQRNITDYLDSSSSIHRQREVSLFEDDCFSSSKYLLDKDGSDGGFEASTPKHHYFGGEGRDDQFELTVSVRDKTYSHKPKPKKIEDFIDASRKPQPIVLMENTYFEDETLTPKMKRGGNRNNLSHRKAKGEKIENEEEETEQLFANLSLEYEKIENFPLLID